MLPGLLPQGATRGLDQIHSRSLSLRLFFLLCLCSFFFIDFLFLFSGDRDPLSASSSGVDLAGGGRRRSRTQRRRCPASWGGCGGLAAEPVLRLQETSRADRVQMQVRDHILWGPQVPGEARVFVRFQDAWERGDRQKQPLGHSREAREDMIRTVGSDYSDKFKSKRWTDGFNLNQSKNRCLIAAVHHARVGIKLI